MILVKPFIKKAVFFLFVICTWNAQADVVDDQAQISARKILKSSNNLEKFLVVAQAAWQKNCNFDRPETCSVTECDITPNSCRPNRILLFRGEAERRNYPGVSHFLRTRWAGSSYSKGNLQEWLNQFKIDLELLRPMTMGPDLGDSPMLVRGKTNSHWRYQSTDVPFLSLNDPTSRPLSLLNVLFTMHTQAAYPLFEDRQLGQKSLDPLVSFSLAPSEAYKFSEKKGGLFIVVSVPRNDLHIECDENLPDAGQFFDPTFCSEKSLFPEEMEFDAFLFVAPQYIYKSFIREN